VSVANEIRGIANRTPSANIKSTSMRPRDKPLVWLRGAVKTPPFGPEARVEAGFLLRRLQRGEHLDMPHSRPMPAVGARCHELRVRDGAVQRIMYHIAPDAIVILDVFPKKTAVTPTSVLADCRARLAGFRRAAQQKGTSRARR
jgi:phage-related protein